MCVYNIGTEHCLYQVVISKIRWIIHLPMNIRKTCDGRNFTDNDLDLAARYARTNISAVAARQPREEQKENVFSPFPWNPFQ